MVVVPIVPSPLFPLFPCSVKPADIH
jgi:hypothetical protein